MSGPEPRTETADTADTADTAETPSSDAPAAPAVDRTDERPGPWAAGRPGVALALVTTLLLAAVLFATVVRGSVTSGGEGFDDGFTRLDAERWATVNDTHHGNNELQWYLPSQVSADGDLHLRAERQDHDANGRTYPFVSGMIRSQDRFAFQYGTVEVTAKLPRGKGWWPAAWLLPDDGSWPPELDVFEGYGKAEAVFNAHWQDGGGSHRQGESRVPLDDGFHRFALTWTRSALTWRLDGTVVKTVTDPAVIPHLPMYVILNLAVNGNDPPDSGGAELVVRSVKVTT